MQSRLFGKSIEKKNLSPRRDSNSRPLVYKTSALTTELQRLVEYVGSKIAISCLRFYKIIHCSCIFPKEYPITMVIL